MQDQIVLLTQDPVTLQQVLEWAGSHIMEIVVVASIFFEITPIKFNPITMLLEFLFKGIRKEMTDMKTELKSDIDTVKSDLKKDIDVVKQDQTEQNKTINDMIRSTDLNEASRLRWNIIEFANSIDNSQLHTRDEYRHIQESITRYHRILQKHGKSNGIIDEAVEKISTHYNKNKNTTSMYF